MRIIDLARDAAGSFATMLLAELGADVIKVEPPSGDPWRSRADAALDDLSFDYLNRRKRGITLDIHGRQGRELLLRLVDTADAVVESVDSSAARRRPCSVRAMRRREPGLVVTSISNFGLTGPRKDWKATELVLQAMGGVVHTTGWQDGPPLKLPGYQASYIGGLNAAIATLTAVLGVQSGEAPGVHIDLSIQECFSPHWSRHISRYIYGGVDGQRAQRASGPQVIRSMEEASDGYVFVYALRAEWESFAFFLGLERFITSEWSDPEVRRARWAEIEPYYKEAVARRGKYEWFTAAAAHGYTFAPVDDPTALLSSPQLAARDFFSTAELSSGAMVAAPRLPFTFTSSPRVYNRPPRLGEHNSAVYGELLGLDVRAIASLQSRGLT